ncbi:MAG: hypothetical protein J7L42_04005 [Elusimicrobia bacterium]|nr:hypothetical protein [Elusimicrobiota bacterium]
MILFFAFGVSAQQEEEKKSKLIKEAVKLWEDGDYPGSMRIVEKLLKKYAKDPQVKELYYQIKDDEAKRVFEAARIYFEHGELDLAKRKILEGRTTSIEAFEKYIDELFIKAKDLLSKQEIVKCSQIVSFILFADPSNSEARKMNAFLKSSFFKEIYKSIIDEKKKLALEKLKEAQTLKTNPVKAIVLVNEALKLDPSNSDARRLKKVLLKKISKQTLLEKKEEITQRDRERAINYYVKAEELFREKKFEKCHKLLKKALKYDPENKKAKKLFEDVSTILCDKYLKKAQEFYFAGKIRKAKKYVKKARYYDSARVIAYAQKMATKGRDLIKSAQNQRGGQFIAFAEILNPQREKSLLVSEENIKPELDKVWNIYYSKDYKKALAVVEQLERSHPDNLDVLFLKNMIMAQISLDEGKFIPTRNYLLKAIKIKPLHQEVWGFFNRLDEVLKILGYDMGQMETPEGTE